MSSFQDQEITCVQCGMLFTWTKGEREFLEDLKAKGKIESDIVPPKRCRGCRLKKKRDREDRENRDY